MILDGNNFQHHKLDYMQFDRADLGWAAGFIDGDGTINMYKRKRKNSFDYYVKLSAVNTNRTCLEKLQLMFGGSICQMHSTEKHPKWRNSWIWTLTHKRAEKAIKAISPYLLIKHEQSVLAIAARELIVRKGDNRKRSDGLTADLQAILNKFRKLNSRGLNYVIS